MREPYGYIFILLSFSCLMYIVAINPRTAMAVRSRFSKSNIKKNKRGFINRLTYYKFHKERPLGVWFYLNIICLVCVVATAVLFPIFYRLNLNEFIYVIIFTVSYLFIISVGLIANVKTTEYSFKMKNSSVFSTYMSIILSDGITAVFSIIWILYCIRTYMVS